MLPYVLLEARYAADKIGIYSVTLAEQVGGIDIDAIIQLRPDSNRKPVECVRFTDEGNGTPRSCKESSCYSGATTNNVVAVNDRYSRPVDRTTFGLNTQRSRIHISNSRRNLA